MQIHGRHELVYVGHRNVTGVDDRTLRRDAERGLLVRVRRGVYVAAAVWQQLSPDQRYRLTVAAALDVARAPLVASHRSAAALWGMPDIAPAPTHVDVVTSLAAGSRVEHGFRKHASARPELHVVEIDGLPRTTLERTVVDLARAVPFAAAVVAADWALCPAAGHAWTTLDALHQTVDEIDPGSGRRRIETVLAFADGRSGSAGESLSRAVIHELRFPAPELQVRFDDARGFVGIVDFYWETAALIGEFDGRVKYVDEAMLRGRSPSAVVVEEKRREDRLRAIGPRVARWTWDDARSRTRLAGILQHAGLRPAHLAA